MASFGAINPLLWEERLTYDCVCSECRSIVVCAFFLHVTNCGVMYSLSVYFPVFLADFSLSATTCSWISAVFFGKKAIDPQALYFELQQVRCTLQRDMSFQPASTLVILQELFSVVVHWHRSL
ncbi:hypothetical protein RvY_04332 [Ramazzottius varieornatus]|uniref:Uncharacterized protein n=1 Tax=Ramazzottius varieornatus TaxID=947166 RepID=A0A1D1UUN4_RAMVA|nr:hypothetical protein RvY_04332 [Ramazzottius varieornatus]